MYSAFGSSDQSVRSIAMMLTVGFACFAVVGCSSGMVEADNNRPSLAQRYVEETDPEEEETPAIAAAPAGESHPRNIRTRDGRPAPYGRDPVTGRPIREAATAPDAVAAARAPGGKSARTVTVAKGETLTSIASRHKIDVQSIKSANNLTSDEVRVGQKLTLPGA